MRFSGALLALAAVACAAVVAADTTGTTLRGFTFTSDVSDYLNLSQDICDMKKLLNTKEPPYKQALSIYMDGKNAKRADGSILSLRDIAASGKYGDTPFWQMYAKHFGSNLWLDDTMQRAMLGLQPFDAPVERVQLIAKSLESNVQVAIVMTRLQRAQTLLKAGNTAGALAAIDKAWAVYVGGNTDCGLWTVSMKRANEFGTKVTCESSQVSDAILKAFTEAQKAVRDKNAKGLAAATEEVQKQLIVNYMQAVITYAHEMYLDKAAKLNPDEHQVEAYAFYRTIAPLVAAGNKTAAAALDYYLFPGNPAPANVDLAAVRALGTIFKKYGITAKDLGEYGKKQPDLNCKAYVSKDAAGGLLSSTDAKDSLRPTEPAAAGTAASPAPAAAAAAKPAAATPAPAAGRRRL